MKRFCICAIVLSLATFASSSAFAQGSKKSKKSKKKKAQMSEGGTEHISDAGNFGIGITGGYGAGVGGTLKLYSGDTNAFQLEAGVPVGIQGSGFGGWTASLEYVTEYLITESSSGDLFWGIGFGPGVTNIQFDTAIGALDVSGSITFVDIHLVAEFGYHITPANLEILANYKPGFFVTPIPFLPKLGTAGISLRYFF